MRKLFVLLFLSCKEATRLASDSRQRQLTLIERIRMRFHMRLCLMCRRWEDQMYLIDDLFRQYPEVIESQDSPLYGQLSLDTKERMRQALQEAQLSS